jgi:hypothetical protein
MFTYKTVEYLNGAPLAPRRRRVLALPTNIKFDKKAWMGLTIKLIMNIRKKPEKFYNIGPRDKFFKLFLPLCKLQRIIVQTD